MTELCCWCPWRAPRPAICRVIVVVRDGPVRYTALHPVCADHLRGPPDGWVSLARANHARLLPGPDWPPPGWVHWWPGRRAVYIGTEWGLSQGLRPEPPPWEASRPG